MKVIVSLYLWTLGGIAFGALLVIGIIWTYLLPPEVYDPWVKKWLRFVFKVLHTKVNVEGTEKIEPNKPYLFMANHVSIFDIPLLGGYIPNFVRGVEADNQFKWFLYGWAIRRYGNIPIARENVHRSITSIRKAEQYLRSGKSIAILPEGHRTLDGKLRPFKKLPFFLAKQAAVDVVPIGLSGLYNMKRKGTWHIRPTTVTIRFGSIIPAERVESLSVNELRDLTRREVQSLIERP